MTMAQAKRMKMSRDNRPAMAIMSSPSEVISAATPTHGSGTEDTFRMGATHLPE